MGQKFRPRHFRKFGYSLRGRVFFSGNVPFPLENSGNADLTYGDQFQIAETRVLIMEDMLVFLQEKDQKFSLLSLDQKVREFFLCVSYSTL